MSRQVLGLKVWALKLGGAGWQREMEKGLVNTVEKNMAKAWPSSGISKISWGSGWDDNEGSWQGKGEGRAGKKLLPMPKKSKRMWEVEWQAEEVEYIASDDLFLVCLSASGSMEMVYSEHVRISDQGPYLRPMALIVDRWCRVSLPAAGVGP